MPNRTGLIAHGLTAMNVESSSDAEPEPEPDPEPASGPIRQQAPQAATEACPFQPTALRRAGDSATPTGDGG